MFSTWINEWMVTSWVNTMVSPCSQDSAVTQVYKNSSWKWICLVGLSDTDFKCSRASQLHPPWIDSSWIWNHSWGSKLHILWNCESGFGFILSKRCLLQNLEMYPLVAYWPNICLLFLPLIITLIDSFRSWVISKCLLAQCPGSCHLVWRIPRETRWHVSLYV